MSTVPRLTARFAVVASFAALLAAACSPDSKDLAGVSGPTLSASRNGGGGAAPSSFTVLADAAVTCTNGTITGSVGTFRAAPTGAVTLTSCPITGTSHVGTPAAIQAFNAFLAEYTALAPKPGDACPLITGTLAGQNLPPGTYCVSAEAKTGVLTLTGPASGSWTFKVAPGAFTGTSFSVVMAGGAQPCNVTWWVDAAATLTDSNLKGRILAGAAITLTRGTLIGNAFAKAGATVTGTAITGCASSGKGKDKDKDKDKGHGGDDDDDGDDDGDNDGDDDGDDDDDDGDKGDHGKGPKSPLGTAGNFTVLGDAAVTCTDGTITGNVGTFQATPTGAITVTTCPITGTSQVGTAAAIQAYNSFLSAYTALAPKPGDACPIITGTLAGQNLPPGVYCVSAEAKTGVLTLTGPASGSWTFKVAPGAFTGTSFSVIMAGGAQACNVTWWVDAATTMTDSHLKGTILSGAAITLTRGTLIGRAFAKAGVTVTGTAVTGCASGGKGKGDKGHHGGDDDGDDGRGDKGHHGGDDDDDDDGHGDKRHRNNH